MRRRNLQTEINRTLLRAWATVGIPSSVDPVDESKEGLIDPEALLVTTAVFGQDARLFLDVVVWVSSHSELLIHGKIANCRKLLSPNGLRGLDQALKETELQALPTKVMLALGGKRSTKGPSMSRAGKFSPLNEVAKRTRMLFNRLLFGAAARADIVSVLQLAQRPASGKKLAELLAVNPSTVSRVLDDLRECGQLDRNGRFISASMKAPGMFISSITIKNLLDNVDANQVTDDGLRQAMLPDIDASTDGFGHSLFPLTV